MKVKKTAQAKSIKAKGGNSELKKLSSEIIAIRRVMADLGDEIAEFRGFIDERLDDAEVQKIYNEVSDMRRQMVDIFGSVNNRIHDISTDYRSLRDSLADIKKSVSS